MTKMAGMANETRERQWAERVAEWRASGRSARAYCEGRDFNHRDLYRWGQRLKRAAPRRAPAGAVQMVRVESRKVTPPQAALTIELGATRVAVPAGYDGATLRTVLEALGETSRGGRS